MKRCGWRTGIEFFGDMMIYIEKLRKMLADNTYNNNLHREARNYNNIHKKILQVILHILYNRNQ